MLSDGGRAGGYGLPARLHAAVSSVYRRWAEDMPFTDAEAELDMRPLPEGLHQRALPEPRPPFWDGWVYELLRRLCGRGRRRLPEQLTELADAPPVSSADGLPSLYGAVYGVWINLLDVRLEWYGAAARLAELSLYVDYALHRHGRESPRYQPWLRDSWSPPPADRARREALAHGLRRDEQAMLGCAERLADELSAIEAALAEASTLIGAFAELDARDDDWEALVGVRQLLYRLESAMATVTAGCLEAEPMLVQCMAVLSTSPDDETSSA